MYERSELDYLIYNAPLEYADLILNGDPETYLKTVTEYRPLKQIRMYTDFENIEEILTECGFKFCNRTIDEKNRRYTRI